ncbi:MAG: carboxylating nicotinate-nucleotide diphosphorylase [Deltaproteobacteria bacterium]|nr:carboxylating nicotinate-nucleotide diphosphorylase [Deltaproteobacteria bacterium]
MTSLPTRLIDMALAEDIGTGDITTDYLISCDSQGRGIIVAKEDLILAGLDIAKTVFQRLDPQVHLQSAYKDGAEVVCGETVLQLEGSLRALLTAERPALNFLQHLSGIATHVRTYVKALQHSRVRLVDTRKTTPGWRVLEKYAVRMGGAHNHRMGLFDGVLIKDNHIAACGGIQQAVAAARKQISHLIKIEIEVSDLAGIHEALESGVDVIMLDNMDIAHIREAVSVIKNRAIVEVSGGVTLNQLSDLAQTGVDLISVGALTHSARAVDLSMRIQ